MVVRSLLVALAVAVAVVTPAAAKDSPGKPPPKPPRPSVGSWAQSADAVCRTSEQELNALVSSVRSRANLSDRARVLELLDGSVRVEGRTLAQLAALQRPQKHRGIIATTLGVIRREHAADLALLAKLRRRWDPVLLARQLKRDRAWNAELRLLFIGLGSEGCADYFSSAPAYAP